MSKAAASNKEFRAEFETNSPDSRTLLKLIGPINETADLEALKTTGKHQLEIDMGQVTSINSIGIRAFRNWTASLQNQGIRFSFVPRIFVNQLNMIRNLIPAGSKVVSFYVPFFASDESEEKNVLYSIGVEFKRLPGGELELIHPEVTGANGVPMEMDVPE